MRDVVSLPLPGSVTRESLVIRIPFLSPSRRARPETGAFPKPPLNWGVGEGVGRGAAARLDSAATSANERTSRVFRLVIIVRRPSRGGRAGAPVGVLQADDVVQFRRRHFDQVAAGVGAHAVTLARTDAIRAPFGQPHFFHLAIDVDGKDHFTPENVEGLVLSFMVLEGEGLARLQMEDFPGITLVLGENQLVPPRLRHGPHGRPRISFSTSDASARSSAFSAKACTRVESIAKRESLTPAIATGVTETSRIPRPTKTAIPIGSAASSPQTATGRP